MNDITPHEGRPVTFAHDFATLTKMAEAVAKCGLFGMKTTEQALALMMVAQSEGVHPATITQDYDIIQGRAARKTNSVLARFQAAGGEIKWEELTDTCARAVLSHPKGGSVTMEWTWERASKVKNWSKDKNGFESLTEKLVWQNYPRAMLRARCIAEGVRAVYPAAIGGMLVVEEAQDMPEQLVGSGTTATDLPPAGKPVYPQEGFNKNMPAWKGLIEDGKKTAEQIISVASSKYVLTPEQQAEIRAVKVLPTEAPKGDAAPAKTVTYAVLREKMEKATDVDLLDAHADLIKEVDASQQDELTAFYKAKREELTA